MRRPVLTTEALIVAHGQPSDPAPAEADLDRLRGAVAALLPGWTVRAATLAAPGALDRALHGLSAPCVLPFFMADGWFTRTELPRRLAQAGRPDLAPLPAFGMMPEAVELAVHAARTATLGRGWRIEETRLLLAAHGSGRGPAAAAAADRFRLALSAALPFAEVRLGFIEQAPTLDAAAAGMGRRALCLPLLVANWDHMRSDVPAALAAAAFAGPCLAPLGARPEVPALLAGALLRC